MIIEVEDHLRRNKAYYPVDKFPVSIGRGYGNDIILPDPHVCAEHLLVQQNEGGWLVEDLNTKNGITESANSRKLSQKQLVSGDSLTIGKTRLHFVSPDHPVEPARSLHDGTGVIEGFRSLAIIWGLLSVLVLGYALDEYLASSREVHIEKIVADSLAFVGGVIAWASAWALMAYIVRRRLYFYYFLSLTVGFVLLDTCLGNFNEYLAYNLNSTWFAEVLSYVTAGILLLGLFYASMQKALMITRRKNLLLANLFSWGFVAVIGFVVYANHPEFNHNPEYPGEVKPPFSRIVSVKSLDQFMAETENQFNKTN